MSLIEQLHRFVPLNEQETRDKDLLLHYLCTHDNCFSRDDTTAHITVSAWTINKDRTKTLMVYHKLYNSWSWIGGHADGDTDLQAVAMRELQEETGVHRADLASNEPISLEILPVSGHVKNGVYISSHLHLNITYLVIADESEPLTVNTAENTAVKWFTFEEALAASAEPWMVQTVYRKLIQKSAHIV